MDVPKTLDCTYIEEKDLVSRYVGQKLSPEEAEAFEEHYFGCDRCWAEVQAGTEVRAALGSPALAVAIDSKRVIRGPWKTVGLLAAAAALALVAAGVLLKPRGNSTNELILASEQLTSRPIAARLTDPFPYRPLERAYRGPTEDTLPLDVRRAALDAQKRAQEDPTPSSLRAAGVAHLLMGEFDEAIASLEKAKAAGSNDTGLLNDLAAAYYSRAQHRDRVGQRDDALGDLNEALKLIRVALEKNPSLAQAAFNRALILESQQFREQAVEAWRRYLEIDPGSKWSEEARAHLSMLKSGAEISLWDRGRKELEHAAASGRSETVDALVARYSQQSRLYVEDEILPAWGTAFQLGSTEAPKFLRISREVGASLARRSKDSLVSEAVAQLDGVVTAPGGPAAARRFAEAYRLYGEGRSLFKGHEIEKAVKLLVRAEDLLAGAGSIFATQVRIVLASSRFYQSDLDGCEQYLDETAQRVGARAARYGSVISQMHWLRGLVELSRGHAEESLRSYRLALEGFEKLGEAENTAAAHTLLAENLQYLGDVDSALDHRKRALTILNDVENSPRLHTTLREVATGAYELGRYEIASSALQRLVAISAAQGSATFMADALLLLSITRGRMGDRPEALQTVVAARKECARIDDPRVRERSLADIDAAEASLWVPTEPAKAAGMLSSAVAYFEKVGNHSRLAQVYLERALARRRLGDTRGLEADLLAGAAELERERSGIADDQIRLSYFETGKDIFDELVGLAASRGDAFESLTYAERSRARSLLDRTATWRPASSGSQLDGPHPLDAAAIASQFPSDMALVEYRVLPDRVVAWAVKRGDLRVVSIPVGREILRDLVARFRRSLISARDDEGVASATELHDLLIRPLSTALVGLRTLVIVPDKFLCEVPFAALRDSRQIRFLVEDFAIANAPSATLFLRSVARSRGRGVLRSALVISNPTFDRRAFPKLPSLEYAAREAETLRARYPLVEVESGREATKRRFLERAPRFDVVHFAGHAIANGHHPSLSSLLMAPDPGSGYASGYLYAHEIENASFRRTKLVVLGACSTLQGPVQDVEGLASLAGSFLKAGAPAVLATLWEVDDEVAAELLARFHEYLSRDEDGASALRGAQRSMLSMKSRSISGMGWAAFALTGWVGACRPDSKGT